MKKEIVSYTLDNLPPVNDERWKELEAMALRPDDEIDTSDIPELTAEQMKNAVRGYVNGVFRHPGLRRNRAA